MYISCKIYSKPQARYTNSSVSFAAKILSSGQHRTILLLIHYNNILILYVSNNKEKKPLKKSFSLFED